MLKVAQLASYDGSVDTFLTESPNFNFFHNMNRLRISEIINPGSVLLNSPLHLWISSWISSKKKMSCTSHNYLEISLH